MTRNAMNSNIFTKLICHHPSRIYFLLFIFTITFTIAIVTQLKSHVIYYLAGGMGILSGTYVLIKISQSYIPSSSTTLLFYRTICDIGIAARFIFGPLVDKRMCGEVICDMEDLKSDDQHIEQACNAPAAILEFFEIASEAWFLCMAIDLAITLNNPFSPFRKRIIFYHCFCWGFAGLLAFLVATIPNVAGLWVVNSEISASYICWLKSDSSYSDYQPWVFLYIPIIVIYSYALYVLICASQILKKGIPITFLHRIRTLDTSKNMLTIFSLYYTCVVCLGILTNTVKYFWPALSFTFSTKALLSLVVFWMMEHSIQFERIATTNERRREHGPQHDFSTTNSVEVISNNLLSPSSTTETSPLNLERDLQTVDQSRILYDLNHALQHEVITYATVGIQQCAIVALNHSSPSIGQHSSHSNHDIRPSLFTRQSPSFPRTLTNTTNHSQHQTWNEYYSLQIQIPQDLFLIDNEHFNSLARGSINDLHNALKTSSQMMTVPALKSMLQTKFISNDYHPSDDERLYGSESDQQQPRSRPSSWNNQTTNTRGGSGAGGGGGRGLNHQNKEEKTGQLTDELIEQNNDEEKSIAMENITILPLNKTNLLSQMKLNVRSITRPSEHGSETIPRRGHFVSTCDSIQDFFGRLAMKIRRHLRTYPVMMDVNRGVEFNEYCPTIFREIRKIYGIEQSYATAFEQQVENRATEGGASNALFFYSKCNRFIVKSCSLHEMKQIRLKAHYLRDHFQQHPKSMITKIFGAYKLQMYACDLYFIVTNNVLHTTRRNEIIHEKYDLKGSSVYRNMTPPKSGQRLRCKGCGQWFIYSTRSHLRIRNRSPRFSIRESNNRHVSIDLDQTTSTSHLPPSLSSSSFSFSSPLPLLLLLLPLLHLNLIAFFPPPLSCPLFVHEPDSILKDNDMRGRSKFRLPKKISEEMIERLRIDAHFLSNIYQTMDYSLLVGVYKKLIDGGVKSASSEMENGFAAMGVTGSESEGEIEEFGNTRIQATEYVVDYSYYMGIIDYQQRYTLRKQIENWVKVHLMRQPKNELSCIDPIRYRDRFVEFIEDIVL